MGLSKFNISMRGGKGGSGFNVEEDFMYWLDWSNFMA